MPQNGQPPVPPPKKDKEFNFGKNLLGILASLLVFIGILLTAWASGSRWIQLCGILAAGLFLMLLGMLASRRKSAYRTLFLSVSGCGAGILYLGIMLGYWYYELLSVLGMYALFFAVGRTDVPALSREAASFPEYWSYRHGGSSIFPAGQLHQVPALIVFRPLFGTGKFSAADNDVLRLHQCIVLSADQPAGTTGKALVHAICNGFVWDCLAFAS